MPTGSTMSAALRKGTSRSGIAATAAAGLIVFGVAGAQAVPTSSDYPTPGQPVASEASGQAEEPDDEATTVEKAEDDLRVAALSADLTGLSPDDLLADLEDGLPEARTVAETAQLNAPDVLVLTGVSYDEQGEIAQTLNEDYLAVGQNGQDPLDYPYVFTAETNSGVDSGADLDGDGIIGGPADALGYGEYPGHYGTVIFSAHPIQEDQVRTFQEFLWDDMPENSMDEDDFSDLEKSVLRLPSATMWDVPVEVDGEQIHLVTSSVALPEDPQDVDIERGSDERRMVTDYVTGNGWYLYDDDGHEGPLAPGSRFVVVGQPVSPHGLDSEVEDLGSLLGSYALQDPEPAAVTDAPLNARPSSEAGTDENATRAVPGSPDARTSYVLPAAGLEVSGTGIFWPGQGEFGFELVDPDLPHSLDDRLVWVDLGAL